jgi:hypothetical protein
MHKQEATTEEQLVTMTIEGLRKLEELFPYEFAETIDTIERLYQIRTTSMEQLQAQMVNPVDDVKLDMVEYAELSGRGEARSIVALNPKRKHLTQWDNEFLLPNGEVRGSSSWEDA